MTKQTAPKFIPEFGLLVAGPGLSLNDIQRKVIKKRLLEVGQQVLQDIKAEVVVAPLIYGQGVVNNTVLRVLTGNNAPLNEWGHFISTQLHLPLHVVQCGVTESESPQALIDKQIVLSSVVTDDIYLSQEQLIQYDTLRAFSDILIWIGDVRDDSLSHGSLKLLRDTLLEGKPVVWLHDNNSLQIADFKRLDEPHRLLLLNSPDSQQVIKALFVDYSESLLTDEIKSFVNPLHSFETKMAHDPVQKSLFNYLTETAPWAFSLRFAGRLDKSFTGLINFKGLGKALFSKTAASWYGVSVLDTSVEPQTHIEEPQQLWEQFKWSDRLANVAAGYHRDVTWCLYLLSTLAVFSAVAGVIDLGHFASWVWPVTELIAVVAILSSYGLSARLNLHGKWLFHRFVAEQIRYTRLGLPLLTYQEPLLAPLRKVFMNASGQGRVNLVSAETWLFKRSVVASGLPHFESSSVYQPDKICHELRAYVRKVIDDQYSYHKKNYHTLHTLEHRLHGLTQTAFVLTVLAVMGHFVIHAQWLLIFTAALPALAAAIHGIVTMNEMGRVSQLSKHTCHHLEHLLESLSRLDKLGLDEGRYFVHLRNITHESAAVMSNGNRKWQDLIEFQSTSLPA